MQTATQLALYSGIGVACLATGGLAQSTADLFDLGELVIEGAADPTAPVAGYVAPTAQTATKSGRPVLETAQSISIVTGEQIEDQGATTLGDTLNYSAGVLGQPFGTDPRFDSPTIRGFDAGNAQYLNGLRILRDFGAPSFEIYSLERVEILKGPASVLYGSGIPGGADQSGSETSAAAEFWRSRHRLWRPKCQRSLRGL
ncbi:TonB-dependent receptor plug domain-containing protein [uncultured Roseobacter sp.]|uniref:TonB-dependent receptor plug domain-containing protein n=1 Tax=uncultured Roseobacter sp. TaxID=114847 RepID=UPI002605C2D2|nr:TonB-dependent receptor plug domain-containing protein [uncultured Roseobacter sp.]